MIPSMDVDCSASCVDVMMTSDADSWLDAVGQVKNIVIGNNKQKTHIINEGIVPRLLQWMIDDDIPILLRTESAMVLGSLAKGTEQNVQSLIEAGTVSVLLKGLFNSDLKFVEACLRCLRTIYLSSLALPDAIYQDMTIVPHMINIISRSVCTQECVTTVLANCCKTVDHQNVLCQSNAISALAPLLSCSVYKVQLPTLKCLAMLMYQNEQAAASVALETYNGESIISLLLKLLARDKTSEMQMGAAKCLTYLCRGGSIETDSPIVTLKTLPTLVRMCKKDRTLEENVEGAETLAYLIEVNSELQKDAAISDHIIKTLAEYLKYTDVQQINTRSAHKKDINWSNELRQAAFRAFASLGANNEDIRKRIIETEGLMDQIVNGMNSPFVKVQLAAVRCLHSLSRSVQQLRTTFQDHHVWKPLMGLLQNGPEEVLTVASSTLCNLLLEFSPSKEPILESGAINIMVDLTSQSDPALRLNGMWALMNMAFQAEQKVKTQILNALGTEQLFRLLSDPDPTVLMKTLGLLRNLLTNKPHIDKIMIGYGTQIMQAVVFILEGEHCIDIKEQTLCILANVADGDSAKDYIMGNEDVLKKINSYMAHNSLKLQIAATFCVLNLVWNEEEGAFSRQLKLKELGVQKLLQQLMGTANDHTLFDHVKRALQQFPSSFQ